MARADGRWLYCGDVAATIRSVACVVTIFVVLAGTASRAHAAPAWTQTIPLTTAADQLGGVAMTPNGTVTVLWDAVYQGRRTVLAATRPPAGKFTIVPVSRATVTGGTTGAGGRDGSVVAAWVQAGDVYASVRSPAGAWSTPAKLSSGGGASIDAAISSDGEALVVWDHGGKIQASRRLPGGAWSAQPEDISGLGATASAPQAAIDANGNAYAVWLVARAVNSAVRPAGHVWTADPPLTNTAGGAAHALRLAIGSRGRAVAVWLRDSSPPGVEATSRLGAGAWHLPLASFSGFSAYGDPPAATVDDANLGTVAWTTGFSDMLSQRESSPDAWQSQASLSNPVVSDSFSPVLASGPSGRAVIAWRSQVAMGTFPTWLHAAVRSSLVGWGIVQTINLPDGSFAGPLVGMDAQGNAVLVWPVGPAGIRVRGYDAAGPDLLSPSVPSALLTGHVGNFAVVPRDRWSAVASTVWNFGDGTSASGARATHVFRAPGRYLVRVTSVDGVGNVSALARTVTVAPPAQLTLGTARFRHVSWRLSRVRGSLALAFAVNYPGTLRMRLKKGSKVRLKSSSMAVGTGSATRSFGLPPRLLPGHYKLTLDGTIGNTPVSVHRALRLRPPSEGVVTKMVLSTSKKGSPISQISSTTELWARWKFARGAKPEKLIRAHWIQDRDQKKVFDAKRYSFIRFPGGVPHGRWTCELRMGKTPIARVSARVG